MKLTRDGAFTLTREGYLVTKDGDYVLNQNGASTGNPGAENYIRINPNLDLKCFPMEVLCRIIRWLQDLVW